MPAVARDPRKTAAWLRHRVPFQPTLAVVLGSGFGGFAERLECARRIPYRRIPGFPAASVSGHAGELMFARFGQLTILVLSGRAHYYEGHSLAEVTFPIRALAAFGIEAVLLTNAAGGISRSLKPGDFMVLTDHINFMGANPLRGSPAAGQDPFVDVSETYDRELIRLLKLAGRRSSISLKSGVYLAVSGPSYETPAEVRAFGRLGADAVGMSTVPEAIVARQCGLRVAAVSCITNLAAGRSARALSHEDVMAKAEQVGDRARRLLTAFAMLYEQERKERIGPGRA